MEPILELLGQHRQLATEQICKLICPRQSSKRVEQRLANLEKEGLIARTLLVDRPATDSGENRNLLTDDKPPEMPDKQAVVFWNLTRAGRALVNPPTRSSQQEQTWRNLEARLSQEAAKAGAIIILMEELCPEMDLTGEEYLVRLYAGTYSSSINGRRGQSKTRVSLPRYLTGLIVLVPEWVEADRWWYQDLPQLDSGTSEKILPVMLVTTTPRQCFEHKEILTERKKRATVIELENVGEFIPGWLKENGVPEPP